MFVLQSGRVQRHTAPHLIFDLYYGTYFPLSRSYLLRPRISAHSGLAQGHLQPGYDVSELGANPSKQIRSTVHDVQSNSSVQGSELDVGSFREPSVIHTCRLHSSWSITRA